MDVFKIALYNHKYKINSILNWKGVLKLLTKYERELVDYWKNWKPGMGPFAKKPEDYDEEKKKVKYTKKSKKEKPSSREMMEEIQFEFGLTEKELDDLLIPEEEWDDL